MPGRELRNVPMNRDPGTADFAQAGVVFGCAGSAINGTQLRVTAGGVWVPDTGGLLVRAASVQTDVTFPATGAGGSFRLDQVIVDSAGVVSRLAGTQEVATTAAALLDSRQGAANVPAGSLRVFDVAVSSTSLAGGAFRDRRPWARGVSWVGTRTAGQITLSGALQELDTPNLKRRFEFTGVPICVRLHALGSHTQNNGRIGRGVSLNGAIWPSTNNITYSTMIPDLAGNSLLLDDSWTLTPAPGSHTIAIGVLNPDTGIATIEGSANVPITVTVEEMRPSVDNGT